MTVYWFRSPTGWRRSTSLEALERLIDLLPANVGWELYVQRPRGRRHLLRSGVGPALHV